MKELSIEEKAKRYDEALKVLHKYDGANIMFSQDLKEEMFPELKESEDEKTKRILHTIANKIGQHLRDIFTEEEFQCFDTWSNAWLEKQGEIDKVSYDIAEKEKYDFVSGQFIECRKSFNEFKENNSYWFEYVGNDTYIGRSDNILNKKFHITPRQLYRLFAQQHCPKENNINEETNAPTGYGKYVDECLNEAAKHFFSEGEDKYSVADLFYAGVRCGKSWLEKQGEQKIAEFDDGNAKQMFIKALERVEAQNNKGYKLTDCDKNSWWEDFKAYCGYTEIKKPADETPYPETLEKAIDLYYYSYGNGKGEFEHLSLKKFRDIVHTFVSDYGQKPAWSEEDEENLNWFEKFFRPESLITKCKDIPQDKYLWFKSLKDRVQPQPKQEWSEVDYNRIETIACHLDNTDNEGMAEVLRNIRDKYYSQNRWKPSDEQMKAFAWALSLAKNCGEEYAFDLRILYEQLDKLK